MFNRTELTKVVDLQQKSFALLQWVRNQMDAGTLDVSTLQNATAFYSVAFAWITRNLSHFPPETRPDEADTERFTHLFVSFLTTSFELPPPKAGPSKRVPERFAHFAPPSRLRARTPGRKAAASAHQMKHLYLTGLADDLGVTLPYAEREGLATLETAQSVSLATYGRELIRRSEFASSGEGVLVLWREFAWANGKLNKKFVLAAAQILEAEAQITARIRER